MKYLPTVTDKTIFASPEFADHEQYTHRVTVKSIVRNSEDKIALITNDVHKLYTLPGGGAESDNLEEEVNRESIEEIRYDLTDIKELVRVKELRNRNATEYETVCFSATAGRFYETDNRTDEEKVNNLRVEWLTRQEVEEVFAKQIEMLKNGEIGFYNTAFNIYRDDAFIREYFANDSQS